VATLQRRIATALPALGMVALQVTFTKGLMELGGPMAMVSPAAAPGTEMSAESIQLFAATAGKSIDAVTERWNTMGVPPPMVTLETLALGPTLPVAPCGP
jgi:hypothetical protein